MNVKAKIPNCTFIIVLFLTTLNCACRKKAKDLVIGDSYEGGIVAYLLVKGDPGYDSKIQHGLIAAPSDQSTGTRWEPGIDFIATGATGTAIGTGSSNTNAIVAKHGNARYAAYDCFYLELGGFSDWYLPSKDELHKLQINKSTIHCSDSWYWSSSEYNANGAWCENFSDGQLFPDAKYDGPRVRAVRSF